MSTIDTEMRIKSIISKIQKFEPQFEEIKDLRREVDELCEAYDGNQSDDEEIEFQKTIISTNKEQDLEHEASSKAFDEVLQETQTLLQQFT